MNPQGIYPEFNAILTSADASGTAAVKSASPGKKYRITDIVISPAVAMWVKLQDDTAGTVNILLPQTQLPGTSVFSKTFHTPVYVNEGKAINILTSTAGTVSVFVSGYII